MTKVWKLIAASGEFFDSLVPGTFGGHRKTRVFGRMNCRAALCALEKGGYRQNRVFFLDAQTARAAGYRPCAVCMPAEYKAWKATRSD